MRVKVTRNSEYPVYFVALLANMSSFSSMCASPYVCVASVGEGRRSKMFIELPCVKGRKGEKGALIGSE